MKYNQGFTLIELIVYIALVTIFLTGAILFAWDVIYGREKVYQKQLVEQNTRSVMARIAYEIRNAKDIQSVSSSQLALLNEGGGTTTVTFANNKLQLTTPLGGPWDLTSNLIKADNAQFIDVSSPDKNSKNIKIVLDFSQAGADSAQFSAQANIEQTVEFNSQFNQARSLLVDLSQAGLNPTGRRIEGITLQNTGNGDLTINKMAVYWSGTAGGENLTAIRIGSGQSEWTGTNPSSQELFDLNTPYVLTTSAGVVDFSFLQFDSDMSGATINIIFSLADLSQSWAELQISSIPGVSPSPSIIPSPSPGVSPTPTPVPSPSPIAPPPTNCHSYCQSIYGLGGSCLKSKDCGGHDEGKIYECLPPNICCCY